MNKKINKTKPMPGPDLGATELDPWRAAVRLAEPPLEFGLANVTGGAGGGGGGQLP